MRACLKGQTADKFEELCTRGTRQTLWLVRLGDKNGSSIGETEDNIGHSYASIHSNINRKDETLKHLWLFIVVPLKEI